MSFVTPIKLIKEKQDENDTRGSSAAADSRRWRRRCGI
jgi:hypothetical protein